MYILCFYVPETALEAVKDAVFAAGAGRIGHYEHCSWQVKGQGQFRPLPGSKPTIGAHDELEYVDEYKVEMVCEKHLVRLAVQAMLNAHPYDEPAWHVLEAVGELPL